jgi:Na+-translocating ferredoxin:NAD+ oxidoreductase RnfD subunit
MTFNLSGIFHRPQHFVDNIGMYRLVSVALGALAFFSIVAGYVGWIAYSGTSQLLALFLALGVALLLNLVVAAVTRISANHESAIITALILFFLIIPGEVMAENLGLAIAVAIAILSKFVIAYKKQHLLNPAAVGAVGVSILAMIVPQIPGLYLPSWWVGNPIFCIPVLILGILVVMKVRKWVPVLWFLGVGLAVYLFESLRYGQPLVSSFETYILSWPALFLAFFMLTEPFTMPPTKKTQAVYGAFVGFLLNTALFIPFFSMTPELALIIGNVLVAPLRVRQKLYLIL